VDDESVGRLLHDRIDRHNLEATGIREWHSITFIVGAVNDPDAGVNGWEWGGTCFVETLWVRDERRGSGLGTALMNAMEAEARRLGCTQMVLETHSFQAPAFYERRGFVRVGEVDGYPRGGAFILMTKALHNPVSPCASSRAAGP
jgi:GNAT superfamily N-acetyltransferase